LDRLLHETRNRCQKRADQTLVSIWRIREEICIGEASIGGDKSYVELLTCLETGHFSIGEDPNR
jgi:hypothetical protein